MTGACWLQHVYSYRNTYHWRTNLCGSLCTRVYHLNITIKPFLFAQVSHDWRRGFTIILFAIFITYLYSRFPHLAYYCHDSMVAIAHHTSHVSMYIMCIQTIMVYVHMSELQVTRDYPIGNSIDGPVMDKFHDEGKGYLYLSKRNQHGAGNVISH